MYQEAPSIRTKLLQIFLYIVNLILLPLCHRRVELGRSCTVSPGYRVVGFRALPGFRALNPGNGGWSVHKTLFGFWAPLHILAFVSKIGLSIWENMELFGDF